MKAFLILSANIKEICHQLSEKLIQEHIT